MPYEIRWLKDGTYFFVGPDNERVYFENPEEHHLLVFNMLREHNEQLEQMGQLVTELREKLSNYEHLQPEEDNKG